MNGPLLKTPLPGPRAKAVIERDAQVVSTSYTRDYPLVIARGEGAFVEDVDGNVFLDCTAGIAVTSTGHSHPDVVRAIVDQAQKFLHMSGTDFYYEPQVRLGEELSAIAGQRANVTKAKKSIATYKLRTGMPIGARVTLRGDRMWEFLDRLINIALPRVRDFRGVSSKAFDGRGNYTLGVRDHFIFPEIDYAKTDKSKGLNVTIVTTAGRDDRAKALLAELGMPFAK